MSMKLHTYASRDHAMNDVLPAPPDHACNGDSGEEVHDGVIDRVGQDGIFEGIHMAAVDFREPAVGFALAIEKLQDHHAADVLLQVRIDARDGGSDTAV